MNYDTWFSRATERTPYSWQRDLGEGEVCGDRLVRIPTGFGKTLGVLCAWLFHRVYRGDSRWPLRLVWTLPMRVLVEQTEAEAKETLDRLGLLWNPAGDHGGRVGVHVLMGGVDAGDWQLWPEHAAVLLGTQDMLLSRALNRGYGAARARWPMDFGLLSQDALWILDEVQLMDVGLATAVQLQAFRRDDVSRAMRPVHTWVMSATLQRRWLDTPDTGALLSAARESGLSDEDRRSDLWIRTTKTIERSPWMAPDALARKLLDLHRERAGDMALTLAVVNTVKRAQQLHKFVSGKVEPRDGRVWLLHSRFRGAERSRWRQELLSRDARSGRRIVVATQVIEAGVDLSADVLVTEVAPWPSLVQRLGRLARRGGNGLALVLPVSKDESISPKAAAPYDADELSASWQAIGSISEASPRSLEAFETQHPELIASLYPYAPQHILLRQDLDELFDTTADLSGADVDVSRFIRGGDERDLSLFWMVIPKDGDPENEVRPVRDALCAVPFHAAQDWLCGKSPRLRPGVRAWVWDYLDGLWRWATKEDLYPGQTVLVDRATGGYHRDRGWDPEISSEDSDIPTVVAGTPDPQERADAAQDREDLSQAAWKTIGTHGAEVAEEVSRMARALGFPEGLAAMLRLAARWHDLGKAHPAFQGSIAGDTRPARQDLAKAPDKAWARGRALYRICDGERRPGFRHELATALALFDVVLASGSDHPALLGDLAQEFGLPNPAPSDRAVGALDAELQALDRPSFDLLAYLICAHHGKLRTRIHASPKDQDALDSDGNMPLRGVRDGDPLPPVSLFGADGRPHILASVTLRLEPASLGLSPRTGPSWNERTRALLDRFGPFTLAWLEALLRAADVRASRLTTHDPILAVPR